MPAVFFSARSAAFAQQLADSAFHATHALLEMLACHGAVSRTRW